MKKIKLNLFEVYELNAELKGIVNRSTGEKIQKGLLDEKLKISVKYNLTGLADKLISEIEKIDKFKQELIKSLGTEDDNGGITIPFQINQKFKEDGSLDTFDINPKFTEYNKELNELLQQEIELEFNEITIEDIDIETEVNPVILFKIINQN